MPMGIWKEILYTSVSATSSNFFLIIEAVIPVYMLTDLAHQRKGVL